MSDGSPHIQRYVNISILSVASQLISQHSRNSNFGYCISAKCGGANFLANEAWKHIWMAIFWWLGRPVISIAIQGGKFGG